MIVLGVNRKLLIGGLLGLVFLWSYAPTMSRAADYLQAKYRLWQKKPFAAIQILERLAVMPEGSGVLQSGQDSSLQIQLLLAGALADIGQWDRAAAVYERIVAAEPSAPALRWAAAKAAFAARDYDAAIRHLQPVLAQPKAEDLYAQALYMQQQSHSADQRDLSGFQAALSRLHAKGDCSWQLLMLEADFNTQLGKKDQAVTLVGQAESAAPDDPSCLRSVMLAYETLGQPAEADRILAHWTQRRPNDSDCILSQAMILARRKEVGRAIDLLQSALENRSDEIELQLGLSDLLVSAKRVADARSMILCTATRLLGVHGNTVMRMFGLHRTIPYLPAAISEVEPTTSGALGTYDEFAQEVAHLEWEDPLAGEHAALRDRAHHDIDPHHHRRSDDHATHGHANGDGLTKRVVAVGKNGQAQEVRAENGAAAADAERVPAEITAAIECS